MAARYPAARSRLPVKAQRRDPPRPYDGRVQRDASSIFEQLAEHATLPVERARMLPLEAYRSPAVLAAEIDTLFGRAWLCVGRAADLANAGDFIVTEIPVSAEREAATRSLVVLRSDDGQIVAFDNVCVHRGARLLDGCGAVNRITCPYHAWVYRLDGSLIGGPHLQQTTEADGRPFEPDAHALAAVRTEVWNDFVFVTLDPRAEPLAPRLAGLDEVVGRYDISSYEIVRSETSLWPTNWKMFVENFMDAYHVFHVHRESFGADGDSTLDTEMYPGTTDWAHHRVVPDGPDLAATKRSGLEGAWRRTIVLAAVFPGFVMQLQPDWLWCLQITPAGTDHVRISWQVAVAPETLDEAPDRERYVDELFALIDQVNDEDHAVVEGIRRSVERPQFDRAPFAYLERNVYDFDRYVATRLTS